MTPVTSGVPSPLLQSARPTRVTPLAGIQSPGSGEANTETNRLTSVRRSVTAGVPRRREERLLDELDDREALVVVPELELHEALAGREIARPGAASEGEAALSQRRLDG